MLNVFEIDFTSIADAELVIVSVNLVSSGSQLAQSEWKRNVAATTLSHQPFPTRCWYIISYLEGSTQHLLITNIVSL